MTQTIYRPLHLDPAKGFPRSIPSGAILDIGGVSGPFFTVGGKELLFADGTTSGNSPTAKITLQTVYNNSQSPATLGMSTGKHLIIQNQQTSNVYFKIDADTGEVIINSNLKVLGTTTTINSIINDSDHYLISPSNGNTVAFTINPDANVTMTADLVRILAVNNGTPIFRISGDGTTTISTLHIIGNLAIDGLINNVDIVALRNTLNAHTSVSSNKHQAREINVWPGTLTNIPLPVGTTLLQVQTVLEFFDNSINNISTQVTGLQSAIDGLQQTVDNNHNEFLNKTNDLQQQINSINVEQNSDPTGFTFIADTPMIEWVVSHNKNSKKFIFMAFDENGNYFLPGKAQIVDDNTLIISFGKAQMGRVNMIFYN